MFLFFWLLNTKIRYINLKWKCFAIMRCFSKVKSLIIINKFPTIIYSNHHILSEIFNKRNSIKAWINIWLDWLSKFNLKIAHWLSWDQYVDFLDRFSQISTGYLFLLIKEKILECIPVKTTKPFYILDMRIDKRYKKYQGLPIYFGLIKYL